MLAAEARTGLGVNSMDVMEAPDPLDSLLKCLFSCVLVSCNSCSMSSCVALDWEWINLGASGGEGCCPGSKWAECRRK